MISAFDRYDRFREQDNDFTPDVIFESITEDDAWAIVAYLRSLEAIDNHVPVNVPVGRSTSETYVHFGVYRSKGLPPM